MKKKYILILVLFLCTKLIHAQVVPYIGEIKLFAGNFAPVGWEICDGRELAISEYETLFILIGTKYGGNGVSTFALPDYRGRAATGSGSTHLSGTMQGSESVALTIANMPLHTHTGNIKVSSAKATTNVPATNSSIASPSITVNGITRDVLGYNDKTPNTNLVPVNSTSSGSNSPINVMQPYLVVNFIIATQGVYPSSN